MGAPGASSRGDERAMQRARGAAHRIVDALLLLALALLPLLGLLSH